MGYFPPCGHSKNKKEVVLDFYKHATTSDLNNVAGVDTWQFAKKDYFN